MSTSRLRIAAADARERLTDLINEGWVLHGELHADYGQKWGAGTWDKEGDRTALCRRVDEWYTRVKATFDATFASGGEWAKLQAAMGSPRFVDACNEDTDATQKLRALMVKVEALEGIRDSLGTDPGAGAAACASSGYYSVSDLSRRHGVDAGALDQRLRRWRKNRASGGEYVEQELSARGDPRFLYRESAVWGMIEELRGVGNP